MSQYFATESMMLTTRTIKLCKAVLGIEKDCSPLSEDVKKEFDIHRKVIMDYTEGLAAYLDSRPTSNSKNQEEAEQKLKDAIGKIEEYKEKLSSMEMQWDIFLFNFGKISQEYKDKYMINPRNNIKVDPLLTPNGSPEELQLQVEEQLKYLRDKRGINLKNVLPIDFSRGKKN